MDVLIFNGHKNIGCFTRSSVDVSDSRGAMIQFVDGGEFPSGIDAGLLVQSVTLRQSEIVGSNTCFNDRKYIYAFGSAMGSVVVRFIILKAGKSYPWKLGNDPGPMSLSKILENYAKSRVSASGKMVKVSLDDGKVVLKGYMDGMDMDDSDTKTHIKKFMLRMTSPDVYGGAGGDGGD